MSMDWAKTDTSSIKIYNFLKKTVDKSQKYIYYKTIIITKLFSLKI
jgi:hypothetical protein